MGKNKVYIITLIILIIISYFLLFAGKKEPTLINDKFVNKTILNDGEYYFDTLAFKNWIEKNFEKNTLLLKCYQRNTKNVKYAVLNYKYSNDTNYIFAVVAKPKEIIKNLNLDDLVGYYSSFGNLDSTKKGTAFFYLILVANYGGEFSLKYKEIVPIHNGFDIIYLDRWQEKNIDFITVQFVDALSQGTRRFNYFFINHFLQKPHLLETYSGIDNLRKLADINGDKYPDYYEYYFISSEQLIKKLDSAGFVWDGNLYVNTRNPKQTRNY